MGDKERVAPRVLASIGAACVLAGLLACAADGAADRVGGSKPPDHEQLVNAHMKGDYEQVVRWCPIILEDRGATPALSDWCLFGYPAALRLSLDTEGAMTFVRSACLDMTGQPQGDDAFRTFYVREVARWVALPMRLQKQDGMLPRALAATVEDFAAVCQVQPEAVHEGLDTQLRASSRG